MKLMSSKWVIATAVGALIAGSAILLGTDSWMQRANQSQYLGKHSSNPAPEMQVQETPSQQTGLSPSEILTLNQLPDSQRQEYIAAINERNQARQLLEEVSAELEQIEKLEQEMLKTEFEYSIRTEKTAN